MTTAIPHQRFQANTQALFGLLQSTKGTMDASTAHHFVMSLQNPRNVYEAYYQAAQDLPPSKLRTCGAVLCLLHQDSQQDLAVKRLDLTNHIALKEDLDDQNHAMALVAAAALLSVDTQPDTTSLGRQELCSKRLNRLFKRFLGPEHLNDLSQLITASDPNFAVHAKEAYSSGNKLPGVVYDGVCQAPYYTDGGIRSKLPAVTAAARSMLIDSPEFDMI